MTGITQQTMNVHSVDRETFDKFDFPERLIPWLHGPDFWVKDVPIGHIQVTLFLADDEALTTQEYNAHIAAGGKV